VSFERRINGVAVTRHIFLVVPALFARTVDNDMKFDGPLVAVELRGELVRDFMVPAFG
jgi:hypothetical protein